MHKVASKQIIKLLPYSGNAAALDAIEASIGVHNDGVEHDGVEKIGHMT